MPTHEPIHYCLLGNWYCCREYVKNLNSGLDGKRDKYPGICVL